MSVILWDQNLFGKGSTDNTQTSESKMLTKVIFSLKACNAGFKVLDLSGLEKSFFIIASDGCSANNMISGLNFGNSLANFLDNSWKLMAHRLR